MAASFTGNAIVACSHMKITLSSSFTFTPRTLNTLFSPYTSACSAPSEEAMSYTWYTCSMREVR